MNIPANCSIGNKFCFPTIELPPTEPCHQVSSTLEATSCPGSELPRTAHIRNTKT